MKLLLTFILLACATISSAQSLSLSVNAGYTQRRGDNPHNYITLPYGAAKMENKKAFAGIASARLALGYKQFEGGIGLMAGRYQTTGYIQGFYKLKVPIQYPEANMHMNASFALPYGYISFLPPAAGRFHFSFGMMAGYILHPKNSYSGVLLVYSGYNIVGGEVLKVESGAAMYGFRLGIEYHMRKDISIEAEGMYIASGKLKAAQYSTATTSLFVDNINHIHYRMILPTISLGINYHLWHKQKETKKENKSH